MSVEDQETEKVKYALSAIANEIQKFNLEKAFSNDTIESKEFNELVKYKTSLKLKKDQIKTLQQNLKKVCCVARTLSASKTSETTLLNNQLNDAKNQYLKLVKDEHEKSNKISQLEAENQSLRDKLQCFNNFIRLGYTELTKFRNQQLQNVSTLKQLQLIIYCCGHYYAEYMNEQEKRTQLERKNSFLNNKLLIVEKQVNATARESGENDFNINHIKKFKRDTRDLKHVVSESRLRRPNDTDNLKMRLHELKTYPRKTKLSTQDLSEHLLAVKKLLCDQDTIIKDLSCLKKELNADSD